MEMEELKDKKAYEIAFMAAAEEDAKRLAEALKHAGAEIFSESPLVKMALAYQIEKKGEAYFGFMHLNIEPEKIVQLEKQFRVQPIVLRFLIITPPFTKSKEKRQYIPTRRKAAAAPVAEKKPASHLSNEALEKQLKEILQ
ncbi:MAG TPA: 30S ribosomal protein S6 [Candidatus Paceibacterota bacterium]|nr:30S ribosomal protein S6 [Candidatus Paceibacterota bacterium]